jgi:hypothetical protein
MEINDRIFRMTVAMEREILWRAEQEKLNSMRRVGLNGQVIMKRLRQQGEAGTHEERVVGR